MPNIISGLTEAGIQYVHVGIEYNHSLCFFNHKRIEFPFNLNGNVRTVKKDTGEEVPILIFNLRFDGQISISDNFFIRQDGLSVLGDTCIIFEHYHDFFTQDGLVMENALIFNLSKELTSRAKDIKKEIIILKSLLKEMDEVKFNPTRNVLTEKGRKTKR